MKQSIIPKKLNLTNIVQNLTSLRKETQSDCKLIKQKVGGFQTYMNRYQEYINTKEATASSRNQINDSEFELLKTPIVYQNE